MPWNMGREQNQDAAYTIQTQGNVANAYQTSVGDTQGRKQYSIISITKMTHLFSKH